MRALAYDPVNGYMRDERDERERGERRERREREREYLPPSS